MDDPQRALSFAMLDARIEGMPDGPASILKTPRAVYWLNILESVAIIFGLLPSLLVQFLTPQWWMVRMAQVDVWSETAANAGVRVQFFSRDRQDRERDWDMGRDNKKPQRTGASIGRSDDYAVNRSLISRRVRNASSSERWSSSSLCFFVNERPTTRKGYSEDIS